MYILCYATANFHYSAALLRIDNFDRDTDIIAYDEFNDDHNNIAHFVPFINRLLSQAKLTYKDIAYVAMTTGPGSFTGIRTGMAFAHGLRLSLGIQVIGIDSFKAAAASIAHVNYDQLDILVVLESRRRDKYFQLYSPALNPLKSAAALMPDDQNDYITDNVIVTGNGHEALSTKANTIVYAESMMFNATDVGRYARHVISSGNIYDYPLVPYYLHSLQNFKIINKL